MVEGGTEEKAQEEKLEKMDHSAFFLAAGSQPRSESLFKQWRERSPF